MDRQVLDRRRRPAQRALRITPQTDLAEPHTERVVGQQAANQRLADPEQELDGLRRLNRSNHSREHAQDASFASGGDEARRWRQCLLRAVALVVADCFIRLERAGNADIVDAIDVVIGGQIRIEADVRVLKVLLLFFFLDLGLQLVNLGRTGGLRGRAAASDETARRRAPDRE